MAQKACSNLAFYFKDAGNSVPPSLVEECNELVSDALSDDKEIRDSVTRSRWNRVEAPLERLANLGRTAKLSQDEISKMSDDEYFRWSEKQG
jgi:hypothetical protein